MASTRAEALARYAKVRRVEDVARVRGRYHRAAELDPFDSWEGPAQRTASDGLERTVRALRVVLFLGISLSLTPVLPALLG